MIVPFHKYEGLGNDFLIVEVEALGEVHLTPEQAIAMCDRHRGIGADGVLLLDASVPSMRVVNSDGSVPEMCGNGLRCAALHLARGGSREQLEVAIDSGAGVHACHVENHGSAGAVTVQMPGASLAPDDIGLESPTPWRDRSLWVADRDLSLTAVSMGNPHAVTFDPVGEARFALGEALQRDSHFRNGVNVGFVSQRDGVTMRLDVLERGAGWTQACGTGAAAAAVAAVETGRAEGGVPLTVRLPGGELTIVPRETGDPVEMKGPARFVFAGEITL